MHHGKSVDDIIPIKIEGPSHRGAPYPVFNKYAINERSMPDNMRGKSITQYMSNNAINIEWITQEPFDEDDAEVAADEILRAISTCVTFNKINTPVDVVIEFECRDGEEYGYWHNRYRISDRSILAI